MKYKILIIAVAIFSFSFSQEVKKLRVISYNTHHCNPPKQTGVIDIDGIANVIKTQNADIALVQEIDVNVIRSGSVDQAKLIAEKSGLKYYHFFKAIDILKGEYGVAIISKYPLESMKKHLLAHKENTEQRVMGTSIVKINSKTKIQLACVHLDLDATFRAKQTQEIDSILKTQKLPIILGGDFNARPESDEMKILMNNLECSTKKFIYTIPQDKPKVTIDYIFINKNGSLKIKDHKVINNIDASDHLPVVVEIDLKK